MWSAIKEQTGNSNSEKYGEHLHWKGNGRVVSDPSQVADLFSSHFAWFYPNNENDLGILTDHIRVNDSTMFLYPSTEAEIR